MSTKKIKMQPKPKAYTRRFVGLRVLGGGEHDAADGWIQ